MKTIPGLSASGYIGRFRTAVSVLQMLPLVTLVLLGGAAAACPGATLTDTNRPAQVLRLFFIHHSTGQNWLADDYGQLGIALRDNNYFVSDSNYGWGPDSIGDTTDIGHWHPWFRGSSSAKYMAAAYANSGKNCDYSRLAATPGGSNKIIMFKSCFPNSALQGSPADPVPAIANNPLKNQDAGSEYHTVANAKGIYIDILNYFAANTNTLFVVIAAPPLTDATWAGNARAFNQWLVNDWLAGYPHANVFVFDFYNVLTSNGGSASVSDLGLTTGHHHRWWQGAVQHLAGGGQNTLAYPSGDDHPNALGSRKATAEFVPLLNAAVRAWQASLLGTPSAPHIADFRRSGATISLEVTHLSPGFAYVLQQNTNLNAADWSDRARFMGVTATNWSEPIKPEAAGVFYRLLNN